MTYCCCCRRIRPNARCACAPLLFHLTPTSDTYTLSLHDALPILAEDDGRALLGNQNIASRSKSNATPGTGPSPGTIKRSEEHTSELQSLTNLVCRLLLEKKNQRLELGNGIRHPASAFG